MKGSCLSYLIARVVQSYFHIIFQERVVSHSHLLASSTQNFQRILIVAICKLFYFIESRLLFCLQLAFNQWHKPLFNLFYLVNFLMQQFLKSRKFLVVVFIVNVLHCNDLWK